VKPRRRLFAFWRDGLVVSYLCGECGEVKRSTYTNEFEANLMADWHSHEKGGCGGDCKRCTKEARDRLYPLPPKGDS